MIIQNGEIISDSDSAVKQLSIGNYKIYYKGLIFMADKKAGEESIEDLVAKISKTLIPPFTNIFGNYFIYIVDEINQKQYIFTDNSGIFVAYTYRNCISTSFLELLDYFKEITLDDLDYESINEIFHLSYPYFYKTAIKCINKTEESFYYFYNNGQLLKKPKNIDPIGFLPNISMDEFFRLLCSSLRDTPVALDLTGGFDSRLVVSYFIKENMDFELGVSAQEKNKDLIIAKKIAKKINKAFYPSIHKPENLTESDIKSIFEKTDAQIDVLTYHHSDQMNKERKSRGVEIQLGGSGGELYKDFWWLQDFPFYNRSKSNIPKLYDQRYESMRFDHNLFGGKLYTYSLNLRSAFIEKLERYKLATNSQTYDNIIQNTRGKVSTGVYVSAAANYFLSYAPLMEYELIKIGFSAKRRDRFYNRLHRHWITKNCKEISTIRTTENITTSSLLIYQIFDLFFYVFNRVQRITKQLLRKIINKTFFQQSPTSTDLYDKWKQSSVFKEHVYMLQDDGILNKSLDIKDIPNSLVGKITTLALLYKRLQK